MLRSLYSGISGMKGFQTKLDVISNNIANVNTVGFKAGRVNFQDILSQKVGSAMQPDANGLRGGMNPKQVGLGSMIGSIDTIFTPGSFQNTNVLTDLAIDGDGFFQILDAPNSKTYFTRAGNFSLDDSRYLVNSLGYYVQGVVVDNAGDAVLNNGATTPIKIQIPDQAYDTVKSNQLEDVIAYNIASDGSIDLTLANGSVVKLADTPANNNPTQFVKVGLVKVNNPGGLEKAGNSLYLESLNAQADDINIPTKLGSSIRTGTLEMSNVDLTNEFSEMIVAQRGFQANSRIITTSDEILQELVNLKR
ncbi:flagellar hook-basal body complex protein [Tepidibacillus marianensis]|uniref:flagellar hook-basal body complex protein n=1 Tax=Tepidibacillus marianensis TaxID=3131995 RepID=UPI0030D1F09D